MILAGGASRRMGGRWKGLEVVGGERILDRVAIALRVVGDDLLLIANAPEASDWLPGVPRAQDRRPSAGGLAGIETALEGGRDVVAVAWDMPFVRGDLLVALVATARRTNAAIVIPESDVGLEPFCAFYAVAIRESLAHYLDAGGRAAHEFARRHPMTHVLSRDDVARFGDPRTLFLSVNTPADLAHARAAAARAQ